MPVTPKFYGVVERGQLRVEARYYSWLSSLEGQRVEIIVRKPGTKRSNEANRYYWGVVVKMIADFCGYNSDEMHEALKEKFLGSGERDEHGLMVIKSSAALSVDEFIQYTNKIVMWAAQELLVYIPSPGEINYD
jgi:hypothetical protein